MLRAQSYSSARIAAPHSTRASSVLPHALHRYLLSRTSVPFLEMLVAWIDEGVCRDPYAEFLVVERPSEARSNLVTDFNCQYWQRRFALAPAQVRAARVPAPSLGLYSSERVGR